MHRKIISSLSFLWTVVDKHIDTFFQEFFNFYSLYLDAVGKKAYNYNMNSKLA